jgi:hypothetical protein
MSESRIFIQQRTTKKPRVFTKTFTAMPYQKKCNPLACEQWLTAEDGAARQKNIAVWCAKLPNEDPESLMMGCSQTHQTKQQQGEGPPGRCLLPASVPPQQAHGFLFLLVYSWGNLACFLAFITNMEGFFVLFLVQFHTRTMKFQMEREMDAFLCRALKL